MCLSVNIIFPTVTVFCTISFIYIFGGTLSLNGGISHFMFYHITVVILQTEVLSEITACMPYFEI